MMRTPRVARWLSITGLYVLLICAYGYSAIFADLGDTVLGPPIVQEALRAFVVVHIARAFTLRWDEFTPWQRLWWGMTAAGITFNLARGNFSDTPLTFSFLLLGVGLIGLTFRLMAVSRREQRLTAEITALKAQLSDKETHDRL